MKAVAGAARLTFDEVLARFDNVKRTATGWTADCPAHDSKSRKALSIKAGDDGRVLLHDFGGCRTEAIVRAAGLTMADLFPDAPPCSNGSVSRRIIATYDYLGEVSDEPLYQTVRYEPKEFKQRRPDGRGGWIWNLGGVRRVPYRLPELLKTEPGDTICICEGEKDVHALERLGYVATTNALGADHWDPAFARYFRDRRALIFEDNDEAGRKRTRKVGSSLMETVAMVCVVRLPGLAEHGDVSDWLAAGHTPAELEDVIAAAPPYDPGDAALATEPSQTRIVTVSTVRREPVEWVWPRRIPRGKKVILDGDPNVGKTTVTLDIVARLTTGREMPDGTRGDVDGPVDCFLLSAEDGIADTIRPRLEAAGADLDRVHVFAAVVEQDGERLPTLADVDAIRAQLIRYRVGLCVVDPLMAFLPGTTNSHRDQDVRRLLAPLTAVCERTRATLLLVRHLNKAAGGHALYRGGGSIGIVGDARAALLAAKDPDDPDRRILAMTKSNLAAEAPALAYRLVDAGGGVARVAWGGTTEHTAGQLLAVPTDPDEVSKLSEAKNFLRVMLAFGAVEANEVKRLAKAAGISDVTLRRARSAIGVQLSKEGYQGAWMWSLPSKVITEAKDDQTQAGDHLWEDVITFDEPPDLLTLAARCGYPEIGIREASIGRGEDAWRAWLSGAHNGQIEAARHLLTKIAAARNGTAPGGSDA